MEDLRADVIETIVSIKSELRSLPKLSSACISIIYYLVENPNARRHLNLPTLHKISREDDPSTLINAVYFLANERVNVLEQHFEALNPKLGRYEEVSFPDIIQALQEKDFANPFTGERVEEKEFREMVIPFFSLSQDFQKKVGDR